MLAASCGALAIALGEPDALTAWIAGCAISGTLFTVIARGARRPAVPLTIATGFLLAPWVAVIAVVALIGWALGNAPPD